MKEKFKPINFNSKNIFVALFTTICLYLLRIFMLGTFQVVLKNDLLSEVLVYTIFIITLFIIERKVLLKQFNTVKSNTKSTVINIILVSFILLALEYISNKVIMNITCTMPAGQDVLKEYLFKQPILFCIYTIILGPILESIVFYYPYKNINNKILKFIVPALVFALFHMFVIKSLTELLFIIPYLFMSLTFAYGLYKTNNIYVTILIHSINNIIAIVLLLFM